MSDGKNKVLGMLLENAGVNPDSILGEGAVEESSFKMGKDHMAALSLWKGQHGKGWKKALKKAWKTGDYGPSQGTKFEKRMDAAMKDLKVKGGLRWLEAYEDVQDDGEGDVSGGFKMRGLIEKKMEDGDVS